MVKINGVKEFCQNYHGPIPENTGVVMITDNSDGVRETWINISEDMNMDKWTDKMYSVFNKYIQPSFLLGRYNKSLDRFRVLATVYICDNTKDGLIDQLKELFKTNIVDAVDNKDELVEEMELIHTDGGRIIKVDASLLSKDMYDQVRKFGKPNPIIYVAYTKNFDAYDGKLTNEILDFPVKVFFDIDAVDDTVINEEIDTEAKAPEEETFDFTDEALKEMKELGGLA